MKSSIFIFLIALANTATACDICGCGAGTYYMGIMPQFSKNFVGVRYRTFSFRSHIGQGYKPFEATRENFQSTELWARIYITPRIQLLSFINYNFNKQATHTGDKYIHGLGDIPLLVNYNIINTTRDAMADQRVLQHNLWLGGGIKLPTGKYTYQENASAVANANFQLGTGSVDYMVNTIYTLRYKRAGLSVDAAYKINTKNSNDYRFGNRISGTAAFFYVQQIKKLGLMPNAGVYYESAQKNTQYDVVIDVTGGHAYFASLGMEAYYKKISAGVNFQTPFAQHLADGHSQADDKIMAHVTYLF